MSTTWEERIEELHKLPETTKEGGKNWVNLHYKDILKKIYEKALEWEIVLDDEGKDIPWSRIREIVPEATKAFHKNDRGRLEYLFSLTKETVPKIRNQLRTQPLPEIIVNVVEKKGEKRFQIEANQKQFEDFCRHLEVKYSFIIKENLTESSQG